MQRAVGIKTISPIGIQEQDVICPAAEHRAFGEGPFIRVVRVVAEPPAGKVHILPGCVEQFNPVRRLAVAIGQPGQIFGADFIDKDGTAGVSVQPGKVLAQQSRPCQRGGRQQGQRQHNRKQPVPAHPMDSPL